METNQSVHTVALQNTLLQDADLPVFTQLLQTNTTLTELDLRETTVSVNGINHLTAQLQTRPRALKLLYNGGVTNLPAAIAHSSPLTLPPPVPPRPQLSQSADAKSESSTTNWSHSYKIAYSDLKIGKELGRGGFGIVSQGTWRFNQVAIKQLLGTPSPKALAELIAEAEIMTHLRSPNIVQYYGCCLGNPQYCIVMEYMPKESLYHVLHGYDTLTWETRYKIVCDIARGLAFLHAENILHRDLKSLNVLLDESLRAKLSDFGLAKMKTEMRSTRSKGSVGTAAWMAPEIIDGETGCTQSSDIYSLGITFWEVASRKLPFENANGNQMVMMNWISRGKRDAIPTDCPPKLASLIKFCWEQDASKRPSAEAVINYLTTDTTDTSALESKPMYLGNLDSQSSVDSMTASFRASGLK